MPMQYVIAYDITENDIRTNIADLLIAKGFLRLQKSVFIGEATKPKLKELKDQLKEISKGATGVVNFFSQCTQCVTRQIELIPEPLPEPVEEVIEASKTEHEPPKQQKESLQHKKSNEQKERTSQPIPQMEYSILCPKDLSKYYQNADLKLEINMVSKRRKIRGKARIRTKVIEITTGVFLSDLS